MKKKARLLLEAKVGKKSLSEEKSHSIQPYKLTRFDDEAPGKKQLKPQETTEEDIQARIKAQEKQGYDSGHAAGYAKGVSDGKKETEGKVKRIEAIISELEGYKERKINELSPDIIALSLEIAKKIIHKEIELDKNIILYIAKEAVKKVGEKEESIIIKVNPIDYEMMISSISLLREETGLKNISIEPLAAISPGGCYIETQTGEIDARIEEQIKEIQDAISTTTDREM